MISYVLNRVLNFRSHDDVGRQFPVFVAVSATNYLIFVLGLTDLLSAVGVYYELSRVIAACCEAVYLYRMMRWVVFRDSRAAPMGRRREQARRPQVRSRDGRGRDRRQRRQESHRRAAAGGAPDAGDASELSRRQPRPSRPRQAASRARRMSLARCSGPGAPAGRRPRSCRSRTAPTGCRRSAPRSGSPCRAR